jgi:phosphoribulokinase
MGRTQPCSTTGEPMASRPILIAVGGDSGTGKSTLCRGLDRIFGAERIGTICLDDYHALDRVQRKAVNLTALDPRANNFAAMEEDLWALREGHSVTKPVYDHHDGTFAEPERFTAKEIVIVQGLFPLYTRALRQLFDVSVWLDPEPALKLSWKIQRDTLQRGYTEDEVRAEIEKRQPDVKAHIDPQAAYADLRVAFHRGPGIDGRKDAATLSARIRKGGRFQPLDYSEFASSGTSIRQINQTTNGFPETLIELDGRIDDATAEAVEDKIWSHMGAHAYARPTKLGEFRDGHGETHTGHALALAQLLIARRIVLVENELLQAIV